MPIRLLDAILLFLVASIAGLILYGIAMRNLRERRERTHERFRRRWEPVLYARMSGDSNALPPLAAEERLMFLILWLHLLGYVRDEAAAALVQAGHELGLSAYVLKLLGSLSDWKRVIAMRAAGTLRLQEAREALIAGVGQTRRRSSLAAVRALLLIDAEQGLAGLQQVLRRPNWSPGAMLGIVKAAGSQAIRMLAALVLSATPGRATQVVRLIELTEDNSALPALRERLQFSHDGEEVAVILHALGRLGGAEDRATVLAFLTHASWLVRMQAACALGSLGVEQDGERLAPLLRDRHWWVRYRAGQSLLRLKGAAALRDMRKRESDARAGEMLDRVLAEGA